MFFKWNNNEDNLRTISRALTLATRVNDSTGYRRLPQDEDVEAQNGSGHPLLLEAANSRDSVAVERYVRGTLGVVGGLAAALASPALSVPMGYVNGFVAINVRYGFQSAVLPSDFPAPEQAAFERLYYGVKVATIVLTAAAASSLAATAIVKPKLRSEMAYAAGIVPLLQITACVGALSGCLIGWSVQAAGQTLSGNDSALPNARMMGGMIGGMSLAVLLALNEAFSRFSDQRRERECPHH